VGKGCLVNADCSSNICTATKCQSAWKVQYHRVDASTSTQQMNGSFQIVSTGGTTAPLSEFKIRYYFSKDGLGTGTLQGISYFAVVGNANITFAFAAVPTPKPTADTYMEVGFTAAAGNLVSGGSTGEVQAAFHQDNFVTVFTQTNDYSFDATKTAFADWDHVTLWHTPAGGAQTLVWGVEP